MTPERNHRPHVLLSRTSGTWIRGRLLVHPREKASYYAVSATTRPIHTKPQCTTNKPGLIDPLPLARFVLSFSFAETSRLPPTLKSSMILPVWLVAMPQDRMVSRASAYMRGYHSVVYGNFPSSCVLSIPVGVVFSCRQHDVVLHFRIETLCSHLPVPVFFVSRV